jgi:thiol-disulfide isomerase/thioredoxin
LPHYQKAYEKYRDNANVVFLAISTDDNDQVVQEFIAENQYAFAAARSPKTAQAYGVTAIPTLIIIGKDGKMQYRHVGFDSNSDFVKTLSQKIDLLLAANVK